jgi:ribosomal protein S18 acetylase RimI-like enzyme
VKRVDEVVLRAAKADDVGAIADLFLACWRTSYRGVLPPHVVGMYGPASARDLWKRSLEAGSSQRRVVVAERVDGSMLGVVAMGRDPGHPALGHVFSLYVHPDAQGLGIGARLMSEAHERFRVEGRSQASLWVFEANTGGRAFYERMGWLADGMKRVEPEYGEQELRLTRSLTIVR